MNTCQLERLFNQLFLHSHRTRLVGGAVEPFDRAATIEQVACLYYREDFLRSALHEIAHWCIAGEARRKQDDFGYWYVAEGRSHSEQCAFEAVEILPQAVESLFCEAIGVPFSVSLDDFGAGSAARAASFSQQVVTQKQRLLHQLPQAASLPAALGDGRFTAFLRAL